jgi:predicted nuclease of restriction endonuclease-like RecB superfamily
MARTRRVRGELRLLQLDESGRRRASELARAYLDLTREHLGKARAELEQALDLMAVRPAEVRLAAGLRKLIEDRCSFDTESQIDPRALRSEIFVAASSALRALPEGEAFDREAFVAEQAASRGLATDGLERALYSDLRAEQLLQALDDTSAERLVRQYEEAQAQAVLLRAVKVRAEVRCATAYAYRTLFNKLKFLRLLYAIAPLPGGGYRIDIDGPHSLFSSVTKYGLQLALAYPQIRTCNSWKISADLRWGKKRETIGFRLQGRSTECSADATAEGQPRLPDEIQALLDRISGTDTAWQAYAAAEILELPGYGLCLPDLRFENRLTGEVAYLEVMGYWSRDAVWRRVELVRKGLPYRILFAVSSRLRVSEAVLDDELPGELYVYKSVMSAREILARLDRKKPKRRRA